MDLNLETGGVKVLENLKKYLFDIQDSVSRWGNYCNKEALSQGWTCGIQKSIGKVSSPSPQTPQSQHGSLPVSCTGRMVGGSVFTAGWGVTPVDSLVTAATTGQNFDQSFQQFDCNYTGFQVLTIDCAVHVFQPLIVDYMHQHFSPNNNIIWKNI